MALKRMDNVGIVVDDLGGTIDFFQELGLELSRFLAPPVVADHRKAPVNALGYLRVMFAVDDIDETLARLRKHGAELVSSEVVQYEDSYRLCHIAGLKAFSSGSLKNSAERRRSSSPICVSRLRE